MLPRKTHLSDIKIYLRRKAVANIFEYDIIVYIGTVFHTTPHFQKEISMKTSRKFVFIVFIITLVSLVIPSFAFAEGGTNLRLADGVGSEIDEEGIIHADLGANITLSAQAINDDPVNHTISYQWYKSDDWFEYNLTPNYYVLEGENSAEYTIIDAMPHTFQNSGYYKCIITDGVETIEYSFYLWISSETGLDWVTAPVEKILLDPDEEGSSLTLSANVTNNDPAKYPIKYEWYFTPAAGINTHGSLYEWVQLDCTSASYTIDNITPEHAGRYECFIHDDYNNLHCEVNVGFDTDLTWVKTPSYSRLAPGEQYTATIEAESSYADVTYSWVKWSEGEPLVTVSSTNTLTIESLENDDFARYMCIATDGKNWVNHVFWILPEAHISDINIDELIVVENESVTISGRAETSDVGYCPVWLNLLKYAPIKDVDGNWTKDELECEWQIENWEPGSMFLDYNGSTTWEWSDDECKHKFSFTIDKVTEEYQGIYTIVFYEKTGNYVTKDISITLGEYGDITLESEDGTKVEGNLHPAAKLNMRPLQNHVKNYFKQHMPKDTEIVWQNDVTLEIYGTADEHQGDLKLHIPVNKKYNGLTLTVLHYTNGEVEELKGTVNGDILTITTKSLSPFAVLAPTDVADLPAKDPTLDEVPKTGDTSNLPLCIITIILAAGAITFIKRRVKTK